jgi:YVTN family beta-propeller protein
VKTFVLLCIGFLIAALAPQSYGVTQGCAVTTTSQPTGMAYDNIHATIWVALYAANEVIEVQENTCAVLATIFVGTNPIGVAFDTGTHSVWVANYTSNTVTKIDANSHIIMGSYPVGVHPRGVAIAGSTVYVANYGSNSVSRLNIQTGGAGSSLPTGAGPYLLAYNPNDGFIYVPNVNGNSVTVITVNGVLHSVPTDSQPESVTFVGTNVFVSCYSAGKIDKFPYNGGTTVTRASNPEGEPTGLTWNPLTGLIWGSTYSGYIYSINPGTLAMSAAIFRGGSNHGIYDILTGNSSHVWTTDFVGGQVAELVVP